MLKLDLSGGNLDRESIYIAPNGVKVQSSAPTYQNSNYYYLGYLFNGTYTQDHNEHTTYWLTNSTGTQTLIFDLTSVSSFFVLQRIRVYPRARNDASSNYRISVSEDGLDWVYVTDWIYNHHSSSNSNYVEYGVFKEHDVEVSFRPVYIRFELTRNGSWGCNLSEIELFGTSLYILFRDSEGYKSYINGDWELISKTIPTEEEFEKYGFVNLALLDRDEKGFSPLDLLSNEIEIVALPIGEAKAVPEVELTVRQHKPYRYKIELVEPYQRVLNDWSDQIKGEYNTHSIKLDESLFVSEFEHIIKITTENILGESASARGKLFLYNTPPQIQAEMVGLELKATIKDLETDKFKYRVLLNGKQVIPVNEDQEYTDFYENAVNLSRLFFSNEVLIGETNTLTIIAVDWYGGVTEKIIEFTAEYMGLMFADINNEFYSTDMGEILKYLEVGPLMAGTSSLVYPIKLINKFPFEVTNIYLTQQSRDNADIFIEFSDTEVPFIGLDKLTYPDIVLDFNDEIIFYVRVYSRPSTLNGGILDVFVKADPVVN